MAADFWLSTGRMPIATAFDDPPRRPPAYDRRQIDLLVDYVASLGVGPAVPQVDPAAGSLAEGADLYEENCAACHSTTAVGGALTPGEEGTAAPVSDIVAPALFDVDATEITEAMLTGPGTMPVFDQETFNETQRNSIVRYVLYLQHPEDRGGADIGRIGPVAEGAVGWIIGLGVLLVVVRWIGTRIGER
jgi:ubiquinol-cytochrome c reductase cytochrome c subunit